VTAVDRIARVEWTVLEGTRPHSLGRNARLPAHGAAVSVPLARLTTSGGVVGVGPCRPGVDLAYEMLGLPVESVFGDGGTEQRFLPFDYPLWDLAAKAAGMPAYRFAAGKGRPELHLAGVTADAAHRAPGTASPVVPSARSEPGAPGPAAGDGEPPIVRCYFTSIYFDDLAPEGGGPEVVAERAREGYEHGHRAFKVKVGRGGRWMDPDAGLERDVAVVEAVRDAVGPGCELLTDANNGYTLNGAKRFLERTAAARIGWLEEPFSEDRVLLEALREWLAEQGLPVLLADGESATVQDAYALAASGVLDVVQCDILGAGFTRWLALGRALDALGVASAPHHFGLYLGNYLTGHLAGEVMGLRYIEWDEATVPALRVPGVRFAEGCLQLAERAGFGIELDDERFARAVTTNGFDLRLAAMA
jgi:L-rhamnonate dehydratase